MAGVSPVKLRMQFVTRMADRLLTMTELVRGLPDQSEDRLQVGRAVRGSGRAACTIRRDGRITARRRRTRWSGRWSRCGSGIRAGARGNCWRSRRAGARARLAEPVDGLRPAQGARVGAPRRPTGRRPRTVARSRSPAPIRVDDGFQRQIPPGDGVYCYPLTLRDGFSRFVLRCDGLVGPPTRPPDSGSNVPSPNSAPRAHP